MASQLELGARAALCRQLAQREPTNRVLWMAEAENWSRLSNEKLRGEPLESMLPESMLNASKTRFDNAGTKSLAS